MFEVRLREGAVPNACFGQLSFSLSTKVFLWESQVVKPEEGHCGFFVRGEALLGEEKRKSGLWRRKGEEEAASASMLSVKHLPQAAPQIGGDALPPLRLGLAPQQKQIFGFGEDLVEQQQVGGCCTAHSPSQAPPVAASCGGLRPRGQAWPLLPLWPLS